MLGKLEPIKKYSIAAIAIAATITASQLTSTWGDLLGKPKPVIGFVGGVTTLMFFVNEWGVSGDRSKRDSKKILLHGAFFSFLAISCADPTKTKDVDTHLQEVLSVAGIVACAEASSRIRGRKENDPVIQSVDSVPTERATQRDATVNVQDSTVGTRLSERKRKEPEVRAIEPEKKPEEVPIEIVAPIDIPSERSSSFDMKL